MRIDFNPSTILQTEWIEIQALIASLRGDDFAYGEGYDSAIPAAPAIVAEVAAPPPPPEAAAPEPAAIAEQLLQVAAAARGPVDVDIAGIPWDARIHSKPPVKTKDGAWRKKRGIDEAIVTSVTAELKQAMSAPVAAAPVVAEAAPPPPADVVAAPAIAVEAAPAPVAIAVEGNAPAAPAPATAAAPAPAPVAPAPTPESVSTASGPDVAATAVNAFAELMKDVVSKQAAGLITAEQVVVNAQSLGLTGIRDLAVRPDLIPAFQALLAA